MSNLTLPKMSYATLNGIIQNHWIKTGKSRKRIAYETEIEWRTTGNNKTVIVYHHGNAIAEIARDWFTLDNAGWHSVTTATRLNRILKDNQTMLPSDPKVSDRVWYFVHIKDGRMVLSGRPIEGKPKLLREFDYSVCHFSRVGSEHHYVLQGGDEYSR